VNHKRAIDLFNAVLHDVDPSGRLAKIKEESIVHLGQLYAKHGLTAELKQLFIDIRPFFTTVPKSRTAKIVRSLIDIVINSDELAKAHEAEVAKAQKDVGKTAPAAAQVQICLDAIAWCQKEKRTFLKQRIQSRLASLYVKLKQYTDALPLITKLIKEVKKFDDKLLLVEIFLIESRAHMALQNSKRNRTEPTAALALVGHC
jgi:26S proteasome regulatory subunit N6